MTTKSMRQTITSSTLTGRAPSRPYDSNRSKMSTGAFIGWYATTITAPN